GGSFLSGRIALELSLKRDLATGAVSFETAVGVTGSLAEALVDLDPAGLDRVRGAKCAPDVMGPDVGSKPIVAIVRHTDGIRLVGPGDGDEHGTEDLLARKAPVVRHVRENGGDRVVAFAQQPFLRRKAANH